MPTAPDLVHGQEAARWGGWQWADPRNGEHFRRCSYCGSAHPEDLAAEPTWRAEWADQKYGWPHKFYVDVPNRHPDALFVIGSANHPAARFVAWADLTPEQLAVAQRDGHNGDRDTHLLFGTRPNHFGKFYTAHLADPALDPAVKATIEQRCGLQFTFTDDGRIAWTPTTREAAS